MGTFVHCDSNGGNVTSITAVTWGTAGAATANGDIAIIPWVFLNTETPTDPTSETWNLVVDNTAGATDCRGRILWHACDGTESGDITGWSTTGAGNRQAAVLYVVRGYQFISGFSVFDETTNSTTHDCPTLTTSDGFGGNTPADGDTILVFTFDRAGSAATVAPPSGWSTRTASVFAATGTGGTVVGMADDSLTDAATFPVNPAAWTGHVSSDDAFTVTLSLRPSSSTVNGLAEAAFGFTGSAAGIDRALGTAATSLGFTATAAGVDRALGSAAGTFGFTATASGIAGTPPVAGQAVAAFGFTATTTGVRRTPGQAAAVFGFTATAAGIDRAIGAAVVAFGFTATGAGVDRALGTAVATFGPTATAAGVPDVHGVAAGVFGFTATASGFAGTPPVTGAASGVFGFTSTANGQPRTPGQASATFGPTATAVGHPRVPATAVASFGFAGTAAGLRTALGVVQALFGFTATANGQGATSKAQSVAAVTAGRGGLATATAGRTSTVTVASRANSEPTIN